METYSRRRVSRFVLFVEHHEGDHVKDMQHARQDRDCIHIILKTPNGRPRRKVEDNITVRLKEIWFDNLH
jgi:hypothetical protein